MAKRKPCPICGGDKPPGRGVKYCDICKNATARSRAINAAEKRETSNRRPESRSRRRAPNGVPEGSKWCPECQRILPLDRFKHYRGKPAAYCPPCTKVMTHRHTVRKKFGLEYGQYDELLGRQGGRCAICGNMPRKYMLAVDHDHDTGQIRGLLCVRCNRGILGSARDSVEMLQRAIDYLTFPPAQEHQPGLAMSESQLVSEKILTIQERADTQARNAHVPFRFGMVRHPGGIWTCVLSPEAMAVYIRESA